MFTAYDKQDNCKYQHNDGYKCRNKYSIKQLSWNVEALIIEKNKIGFTSVDNQVLVYNRFLHKCIYKSI